MSAFEKDSQITLSPKNEWIACHQCDLLVESVELKEGFKAVCPRCSQILLAHPKGGLRRPLSLAVAAVGLFILSNAFPFMSFKGAGQEQMTTLSQNVFELYLHDSETLAVIVFALVVALPCLYLLGTVLLLVPMVLGHRHFAFPHLAKIVFAVGPWAMVDVFLLGVLVSLTKIASLAKVELGLSFGAFVFFAAAFSMLISSMDKQWLWREWERLEAK